MNDSSQKKPGRLYNIEFFRFAFACTIVYFHILNSNDLPRPFDRN